MTGFVARIGVGWKSVVIYNVKRAAWKAGNFREHAEVNCHGIGPKQSHCGRNC